MTTAVPVAVKQSPANVDDDYDDLVRHPSLSSTIMVMIARLCSRELA